MDTMISDDQRKAFTDLIRDSQKRYEADFESSLKSLKNDLAPRFEARSKVKELMEKVRNLKAQISGATTDLRRLGFNVLDDGLIAIDFDTGHDARQEYEEVKRSLYDDRDSKMGHFRKAIFDVWSAKSVDEAREIVRRLM